jgi:hypothetical protein
MEGLQLCCSLTAAARAVNFQHKLQKASDTQSTACGKQGTECMVGDEGGGGGLKRAGDWDKMAQAIQMGTILC